MKILSSTHRLLDLNKDYKCGGAEKSLLTLLKGLAPNHSVYSIFFDKYEKTWEYDGIAMRTYAKPNSNIKGEWLRYYLELGYWKKIVQEAIIGLRPDIILTQLKYAPSTVDIAKKYGIPTVVFFRSYDILCPTDNLEMSLNCRQNCYNCLTTLKDKIQYPFVKSITKQQRNAFQKSTHVVANSNFTAEFCKNRLGVDSIVVYPNINQHDYINNASADDCFSRKYITFLKPLHHKGVDIFIEIANKMRTQSFLVAGETNDEIKNILKHMKNITYISHSDNMKEIYRQTKILLVPSTWNEPFGRVCVEAMVNGIPCVVSNKGALPEVVENSGIVINCINNTSDWIKAIDKLCTDKNFYMGLSAMSIKRAEDFSCNNMLNKFNREILDAYKKF